MNKTFDQLFPKDVDLMDEPVRFDITDNFYVQIRRIENPQFLAARDHVHKKHKYQMDNDLMTDEQKSALMIPAIAKHVLVGWGGEGQPQPYSQAAAESAMRESKKFLADIVAMARQHSAFVREKDEQATKNSSTASSGNVSGGGSEK